MKVKDLLPLIATYELIQIKFKEENLMTTYLNKNDDEKELQKYNNYDIGYITTKRIIDNIKYKEVSCIKLVIRSLAHS